MWTKKIEYNFRNKISKRNIDWPNKVPNKFTIFLSLVLNNSKVAVNWRFFETNSEIFDSNCYQAIKKLHQSNNERRDKSTLVSLVCLREACLTWKPKTLSFVPFQKAICLSDYPSFPHEGTHTVHFLPEYLQPTCFLYRENFPEYVAWLIEVSQISQTAEEKLSSENEECAFVSLEKQNIAEPGWHILDPI